MGAKRSTGGVLDDLEAIKTKLQADPEANLSDALQAISDLQGRFRIRRHDFLYDLLEPIARVVKIALQMSIGVYAVLLIVRRVDNTWNDGFGNNMPLTEDLLTVIAAGLAAAAAIELAYTLFTSGPDEAIDPLLLGLASALLLLLSKPTGLTFNEGLATLAYAISLGLLFATRRRYVGNDEHSAEPEDLRQQRFRAAWTSVAVKSGLTRELMGAQRIVGKMRSGPYVEKPDPAEPEEPDERYAWGHS